MDQKQISPRVKPQLVQIQPIPSNSNSTITFSVQQSPQRQIRPAQAKPQSSIQVIQGQQVLVRNNPNVIQLPQSSQGQRVVFLQPVSTSNGQIYFQSPQNRQNRTNQPQQNVSYVQQIDQTGNIKTEQSEITEIIDNGSSRKQTFENEPAKSSFHSSSQYNILPSGPNSVAPSTGQISLSAPGATNNPNRGCNCSKSKCLKLYCECFRRGEYCSPVCQCNHCHNKEEYNDVRQKAVRLALDRNEDAFKPKVAKTGKQVNKKGKHLKGCNCKRSGCLKKYCECYQAGVACCDLCNCMGCKNREDHDPLADYGAPSSKRARIGVSRVIQTNLTGPVICAATHCLIKAAKTKQKINASKMESDSAVLEQFGKSLREIITFTINQQRENATISRITKPN